MMRNSKPILLVEDDSVDAMTVQRALSELEVPNKLVRKADGKEALEYLGALSNEKPCIILLDLNMPKMNGFEFLKILKADDLLKKIPVVVLTTSADKADTVESFELGVAGYVVKPMDYKEFIEKIRVINLYWTLSELPNGDQNDG
jgi:CheY-like chemotaxis protein